jgi:hypothetical protein
VSLRRTRVLYTGLKLIFINERVITPFQRPLPRLLESTGADECGRPDVIIGRVLSPDLAAGHQLIAGSLAVSLQAPKEHGAKLKGVKASARHMRIHHSDTD